MGVERSDLVVVDFDAFFSDHHASMVRALVEALRQLSLDHRTIIVGTFYLDWSEAQLASALDVAPGTVKSRLNRALARLEALMEHPT